MKILYVHHGTILGGAPLSLLYLAREMERQPGVEMEIVCHAPQMQDFYSRNLKSPINLWVDPRIHLAKYLIGWIGWAVLWHTPRSFKALLKDLWVFPLSIWRQFTRLRKRKPDLVHLNSATLFSSAIAARMAGIPIVWHIREPLQGPNLQKRLAGAFIRKLSKAVITISEEEAVRLGDDHEGKVHVIYNPINVDMLIPEEYDQAAEKKKLGLSGTDKLVISLGGVNPRKGTLEIVESAQFVDPNTRFFIAGPPLISKGKAGPYEAKIWSLLEKLPENKVTFTGNLENIVPFLAACDVLVFAGTKPHFPRPVYEAWQMRKPVAVFEMKGVSNQVSHGENGIVVSELSGQALGTALASLLQDTVAMKRMGEKGRQKAEEKCNPLSVARQMLAVYREILGS